MDQDNYHYYKNRYMSYKFLTGGNATKITEIYLIRHGETEYNKLGISQGGEADIELNDLGKEQAKKTGEYLKKYRMNDKPFDMIFSSPMKRTKETAEIIAAEILFDGKICYLDDLREHRNGKLSGLKKDDPLKIKIKKFINDNLPIDPIKRFDNDKMDKMLNDEFNLNYEESKQIKKRAIKVFNKIMNMNYKKIIIVSHSGLLGRLLQKLFNITRYPIGDFDAGNNCWISYIIFKNNKYKMISPPNTSHLKL
jgi:broad specificity phosphatase PhoE